MRAVLLAGDYELIQVQTQPHPGAATSRRLHLAPLDSVARAEAVGGAVRDLVGWVELPQGKEVAALAGPHLRLGRAAAPDGVAENLTITAVAPEGFWGWWQADRGMAVTTESGTSRVVPDPAGYFCALR
jgi:hypothetical protein